MTDYNESDSNVEEHHSSLDALFAQQEQLVNKASDEEPTAEEGTNEAEEQTNEEKPSEEEDSGVDLSALQEELESYKKRFKDTQQWGNERNKQLTSLLEKAKENEWLSEEELNGLVTEAPVSEETELARAINQQLPTAIAVAAEVTGKTTEELQANVEAFSALVDYDPSIINELKSLPETQRAAYVLKKGEELKSVYDKVLESGSILSAITSNLKGSDKKVEKAIKETEERVRKELEEKYKDYVSASSSSRPKLHGSSSKSTTKPEDDEDSTKVVFNKLFGY